MLISVPCPHCKNGNKYEYSDLQVSNSSLGDDFVVECEGCGKKFLITIRKELVLKKVYTLVSVPESATE